MVVMVTSSPWLFEDGKGRSCSAAKELMSTRSQARGGNPGVIPLAKSIVRLCGNSKRVFSWLTPLGSSTYCPHHSGYSLSSPVPECSRSTLPLAYQIQHGQVNPGFPSVSGRGERVCQARSPLPEESSGRRSLVTRFELTQLRQRVPNSMLPPFTPLVGQTSRQDTAGSVSGDRARWAI